MVGRLNVPANLFSNATNEIAVPGPNSTYSKSRLEEMDVSRDKRVFIFGAGFSKPAGLPLATELLPLLEERLDIPEARQWIQDFNETVAWLEGDNGKPSQFKLNIEQFFHLAHFAIESYRLGQHCELVGRFDGPDTPWNYAEGIEDWLHYLEEALWDELYEHQQSADLSPIVRWAECVHQSDCVITFNYDTLAETALEIVEKKWCHGFSKEKPSESAQVLKLHGSIDWIVADKGDELSKCDRLFEKQNLNRADKQATEVEEDHEQTRDVEEAYCLWRCRSREQLSWIKDRDVQQVRNGARPRTVGIAGLGTYKQLHQIPGLGLVWSKAKQALREADRVVIVGFSLSDFDAMAQMEFAQIARLRHENGNPLKIEVVDPSIQEENSLTLSRFRRVFRNVQSIPKPHEEFEWN